MDNPLVAAPGSLQQVDTLHRVRTPDLDRAARHYRRALSALGSSFEYLAEPVLAQLRTQFESSLNLIEAELQRRNLTPSL